MDSSELSPISKWFAGKVVFVTGATGFMGKVLVEKLLRDCPDIAVMYLLIRTKKGVDSEQRREEYINHMVRNLLIWEMLIDGEVVLVQKPNYNENLVWKSFQSYLRKPVDMLICHVNKQNIITTNYLLCH